MIFSIKNSKGLEAELSCSPKKKQTPAKIRRPLESSSFGLSYKFSTPSQKRKIPPELLEKALILKLPKLRSLRSLKSKFKHQSKSFNLPRINLRSTKIPDRSSSINSYKFSKLEKLRLRNIPETDRENTAYNDSVDRGRRFVIKRTPTSLSKISGSMQSGTPLSVKKSSESVSKGLEDSMDETSFLNDFKSHTKNQIKWTVVEDLTLNLPQPDYLVEEGQEVPPELDDDNDVVLIFQPNPIVARKKKKNKMLREKAKEQKEKKWKDLQKTPKNYFIEDLISCFRAPIKDVFDEGRVNLLENLLKELKFGEIPRLKLNKLTAHQKVDFSKYGKQKVVFLDLEEILLSTTMMLKKCKGSVSVNFIDDKDTYYVSSWLK